MAADPLGAQEMVRISGQQGVPVITVDDQVVVGFDRPRLEQLLTAAPRRPSLGLAVADATGRVPGSLGAYVGRVTPGGPGKRAGLRQGDVVTELGGRPIRTAADLESLAAGLSPNARVTVAWQRSDQILRGDLVL